MTQPIVVRALNDQRSKGHNTSSEPNSVTQASWEDADELVRKYFESRGMTPPLPKAELEDLADACCAGRFSRPAFSAVVPGSAGPHPYEQLTFDAVPTMLLGTRVARISYLADRRQLRHAVSPEEAA